MEQTKQQDDEVNEFTEEDAYIKQQVIQEARKENPRNPFRGALRKLLLRTTSDTAGNDPRQQYPE